MARLEFFFDLSSPWTRLAFHNIQPILAETGASVTWRPFLVGGVFNAVNPSVYAGRASPNDPKVRHSGAWLKDWARLAEPYRDTAVIDSRAPRFNQATIGVLSLAAVASGWHWLVGLLALQLLVGLTLGRRFCLPCVAYFELVQPRCGEGPLEDSRPPRAANMVGAAVLSAATLAYALAWTLAGDALTVLVAALALLAAATGFCTGCEAYKLGCRLTGRPFVSCPLPARPTT